MNRLKSIFISAASMYWVAVTIGILIEGFLYKEWHFGLLVAAAAPALFIGRLFVFKTARTSRNPIWVVFLILAGLTFEVFYFINTNGEPDAMLLAGFSLVLWLIYIFWYSVFLNRDSKMLEIGKSLPSLKFIDQHGESIDTNSLRGKKLVYLFYRGNWCPLCMAQVNEISKQYREINELGAEVLLISPQPHHFTVKLAKKMNVPFRFLTDTNGKVAKQLGLYVKGGTPFGMEILGFKSDTVLPTVIITDESGKILYADQTDNYRVRPEPDTFLKVLKAR